MKQYDNAELERMELSRKYLEVAKRYFKLSIDELAKLRGGKKIALALENAFWREIDGLPPLVPIEEVTMNKLLNEPVVTLPKKAKAKPKTPSAKDELEGRGCGGPTGWRWVSKKGEKPTMITEAQLPKYLADGWTEGSGKVWITNGKTNKKIDPTELGVWKKKGYTQGKCRKNTEE